MWCCGAAQLVVPVQNAPTIPLPPLPFPCVLQQSSIEVLNPQSADASADPASAVLVAALTPRSSLGGQSHDGSDAALDDADEAHEVRFCCTRTSTCTGLGLLRHSQHCHGSAETVWLWLRLTVSSAIDCLARKTCCILYVTEIVHGPRLLH